MRYINGFDSKDDNHSKNFLEWLSLKFNKKISRKIGSGMSGIVLSFGGR